MKRILSILMSVSLVAILLVSMSVTSFAETTYEPWIDIEVEESDDLSAFSTLFEDIYGVDNLDDLNAQVGVEESYLFKVTVTLKDMGLYMTHTSGTTAANSTYDGRWLQIWQFGCIIDRAISDEANEILLVASDDATFTNKSANQNGIVPKLKAVASAWDTKSMSANVDPSGTKFLMKNLYPYKLRSSVSAEDCVEPYYEFYVITDSRDFTIIPTMMVAAVEATGIDYNHDFTAAEYTKYANKEGTLGVQDATEPSTHTWRIVDGVLQEGGGEVEPVTHAFTVYGEGGSVLASADVEEGAAITMPTAPAVTGKTFSHWATEAGGSEVEPATVMGTEDLTYYAVYETNKYTITFNVDGATTTQTVEYGETPSYAGTPSKEGYDFTGWDKDFAPATADTTYTAQFAIKTYTITFIVDGNTTTKTVNHGETPDYGSIPSKAGYNFTGWSPALAPATGAATYTAQFDLIPPTKYEITFVVDGVETKVETIEGQTPVFPGTPAKDGYNFTGWTPAIVPATGAATYTAQFELIPVEPTESVLNITTVERITGDIFPESGEAQVTVEAFGESHTVSAARLHRVHTTFNYEAGENPLVEMGMLFVPKAVAVEAGVSTAEEIVAAGIAKDANCSNLPGEITGGTTGVVFKAGLVDVPEAFKGITIYAIPYYTLSGGARQYRGVIETTF